MPIEDVALFNKRIIEATSDLVCAYKPNIGFYEALGMSGLNALEKTLESIPSHIPIIGDAKRGDVHPFYAKAAFEVWGFDAVTVNAYAGRDTIEPFIAYADRGVFVLCRTSNPSAVDFQNQPIGNEMLFDKVAKMAVDWNSNDNVGLVVGATAPEEISRIRKQAPGLPFLIPGIGAQGGDLNRSMKDGNTDGIALINVSRGISFAGDLSEKAIWNAAQNYVDQMRGITNES